MPAINNLWEDLFLVQSFRGLGARLLGSMVLGAHGGGFADHLMAHRKQSGEVIKDQDQKELPKAYILVPTSFQLVPAP